VKGGTHFPHPVLKEALSLLSSFSGWRFCFAFPSPLQWCSRLLVAALALWLPPLLPWGRLVWGSLPLYEAVGPNQWLMLNKGLLPVTAGLGCSEGRGRLEECINQSRLKWLGEVLGRVGQSGNHSSLFHRVGYLGWLGGLLSAVSNCEVNTQGWHWTSRQVSPQISKHLSWLEEEAGEKINYSPELSLLFPDPRRPLGPAHQASRNTPGSWLCHL
jgi:hypothetical protein